MTVTATNRKNSFPTNGVTVDFPFTFAVTTEQQVKALTRDAQGVETEYTNFTIALNPSTEGGTLTTGTTLNDVTLVVYRDTPLTQQTDYVPGGRFPADSHEAALDKLTLQNQDQQEEIDRSLKSSISDVNPPSLEEYDASVNQRDADTLASANDYTNKQVFEAGSISPDSLGDLTNYQAASVADMILGIMNGGVTVDLTQAFEGTKVSWMGYYNRSDGGSNWGRVRKGAHVEDGGSIFSIDANTYIEANHARSSNINAKKFGVAKDLLISEVENDARLSALAAYADSGRKLFFPIGRYHFTTFTHPRKILHWYGSGRTTGVNRPDGTYFESGTILQFSAASTHGFYAQGPDGINNCRGSSLNDLTIWGNGTSDETGDNTTLKINNSGLDLNNVDTRFGVTGIEVNTMVNASWKNVIATGANRGLVFIYDPSTPYIDGVSYTSFVTNSNFVNLAPRCSPTRTTAIACVIDATCAFGGNNVKNFDAEGAYAGLLVEGRVVSKDYTDPLGNFISARGASSWNGAGSVFISTWFERNSAFHIKHVYSPGEDPADIMFKGLYRDASAPTLADGMDSMLETPEGFSYLAYKTDDSAQSKIGLYSTPNTASQALLNGPEVNSPLSRRIAEERVPYFPLNRPSIDFKSGYNFDFSVSTLTNAADVAVCDIDMRSASKQMMVTLRFVGITADNTPGHIDASYVIRNGGGTITSSEIRKNEGTAGYLQPVFTDLGSNIFRILVNTARVSASSWRMTGSIDVVAGGDTNGGYSSTLTTLI